eukprot:1161866-Pelagomonas_calceolata.AAC.7
MGKRVQANQAWMHRQHSVTLDSKGIFPTCLGLISKYRQARHGCSCSIVNHHWPAVVVFSNLLRQFTAQKYGVTYFIRASPAATQNQAAKVEEGANANIGIPCLQNFKREAELQQTLPFKATKHWALVRRARCEVDNSLNHEHSSAQP